jgi:hypothetical protein
VLVGVASIDKNLITTMGSIMSYQQDDQTMGNEKGRRSVSPVAVIPSDEVIQTTSTTNADSTLFDSSEIVTLKVGNHTFTTSRSTLCSVPSYLEAMMSGRHTVGSKMKDGVYFIDRDGR